MNLYIAGRYSRRDEFRSVRRKLEACGHTCTSRWLDETSPLDTKMGDDSADFYFQTANNDLIDIDISNGVLFFAEDPLIGTPRGGRHVEFGYALARMIPIFVIGPHENVFHYYWRVRHFDSLEDFLAYAYQRP